MQLVLKQAQSYLISTPDTVVIVHLLLYNSHHPNALIKPFIPIPYAPPSTYKTCYLICLKHNIAYICNLNIILWLQIQTSAL